MKKLTIGLAILCTVLTLFAGYQRLVIRYQNGLIEKAVAVILYQEDHPDCTQVPRPEQKAAYLRAGR